MFNMDSEQGISPYGSLTFSGGTFYGMAYNGGNNNNGTVFSFIPCVNNFNEPICVVSIDTATNKSEVIWGRTNSPQPGSIGSYNIYKYNGLNYVLLANQDIDSLTEFVDTTSNPSVATQSYEISVVDSCGESALSAPHTSILLTTTAGLNAYNLSWTGYVGFTPALYRIFRGPSMSALVQIDSVPNTVFNYVDSFPPPNSFYVVEALNPFFSCTPTRQHSMLRHGTPFMSGAFSNGFNAGLLGVTNLANLENNFRIYPNPANDIINIKMNKAIDGTVYITDVLGQQVFMGKIASDNSTKQVSVATLSQGVYFIKIESGNQSFW